MSQQEYQAAAGGFLTPFSAVTHEEAQHEHYNHIANQIRKEKLRLQGFDDDDEDNQSGSLHNVYDTTGILSEMFNYQPRAPQPPPQTEWPYGNAADSAVGMQLFVTNPNLRSPSPPPSTLHMLLPNQSSGGCFGQFTWGVEQQARDHHHINNSSTNPNDGRLSLSLSSSLQAATKAEDFRMGDNGLVYHPHPQQLHVGSIASSNSNSIFVLRNSKYVKPAQELLEEFCSVGRGQFNNKNKSNFPSNSNSRGGDADGVSPSTTKDQPPPQPTPILSAADRIDHQRRKVKLLSMLDEVDRRYNHYCEQMQMVVNSFDVVMGFGAAVPYTALAQKAMSRHFRCLKDAISVQLKNSCEMLGDKDGGVGGRGSGITKGETPRLKLLEQSLRQQRAFHQMGMMEQEAWRPQRGLPERSVNILRAWLFEHFLHPYPSDADKHLLSRQTGLSRNQVSNWFINARVRLWKPMVEEMYQQESKDEDHDEDNDNYSDDQDTQKTNPPPPSSAAPPPNKPDHQYPSAVAVATQAAAHCYPATHYDSEVQDTCRRVSVLTAPDQQLGTTSGSATSDVAGPTRVIRYGTTAGDVSLTLGLRHAGNIADGNPSFSLRSEFGGC